MSNRTELRARGGAGAVKDGAVRSMPTRAAVIAVDGGQPVRRQASQSVGARRARRDMTRVQPGPTAELAELSVAGDVGWDAP